MSTAEESIAMAGEPFVCMRGIAKSYPGVTALDGVDLEVRRGEIHSLLGENGAGKTTLMKILYGLTQPDSGVLEIEGTSAKFHSPRDALARGIGMVHQHFMLVPEMTVAENVALGMPGRSHLLAPIAEVTQRIRGLASQFDFHIDPEQRIDDLSVGEQQQVEILKLLVHGADLLILDEPTASLIPQEWERLAALLRTLVQRGAAVVLITHKLDEIMGVADRCTVLRDGCNVGTLTVGDTDKATLARMMVGRPVSLRVDPPPLDPGEVLLEVEDLWLDDPERGPRLNGVSLRIREHEILGIAGVEGNGQRELVDVLAGVRQPTSGRIAILGDDVGALSVRTYTDRLGAVVPEDRHRDAVALDLSLSDNLVMKRFDRQPLSRRGFLAPAAARRLAERLTRDYAIKAPDAEVLMRQLSGGNQQKSVLARELGRRPRILLAAQPTRGLDVGAMEFVYSQILEHRAAGGATLLVSNDLEEVLSLSDRVAVVVGGRIVAEVDPRTVAMGELGLLMGGAAVTT